MPNSYRHQVERIDRLLTIVEADNPHEMAPGLLTIDVIMFACQSMWHLKDWILNDTGFGAKDNKELKAEIHSSYCLRVCSDLANGSKHLSLHHPKTTGRLSEHTGVHVDTSKSIFRELYYVICSDDPSGDFHGMEV